MTLGQRVAVIGNGRVHQVGPPQEVYDCPANLFVAQFIGSPPMNCVPARRDGSELTLAGAAVSGGLAVRLPRDEGMVAGFRPEALHLGTGPAKALSFTGSVLGLERLGSQLNLEVVLGQSRIVAVVPVSAGQQAFETGAVVPLWCSLESIHLFDQATGVRMP
jgi:multiple sugar transport system ATP-binding protein